MSLTTEQIQRLDGFLGLLKDFQDDPITASFPYAGRMILLHNANPAIFERTHGSSTNTREYYGKLIRDIRTGITSLLFDSNFEAIEPAHDYLIEKGIKIEHTYNPMRVEALLTLPNGFRVNMFYGNYSAFGEQQPPFQPLPPTPIKAYMDTQIDQAALPLYRQSVAARMDRIHKVYMEKMNPRGYAYNMSSRPNPGEMFVTDKMQLVEHYMQAPVVGEDRKQIIDLYLKEAEVFLDIDVNNVPLPQSFAEQAAVSVSLGEPAQDIQSVRYSLESDTVVYGRFDINNARVDEESALQVQASKVKPVFLDILHKINKHVWEVKLYYPDGSIVLKCYIYPHTFDTIKIHNLHLLFDGRFNA